MIPEFPMFKNIELSDREDIEAFTHKYPPYSDFNFFSMWSWDIKGEMRISQLNGNLVVRFTDYVNGEHFHSFLGTEKSNETANTLLTLAKNEGLLEPHLRLLPEISVTGIDDPSLLVKEDRNNHDYIIPASLFKEYNTKKTRTKKNSVNQFVKKLSPTKKNIDLSDPDIRDSILNLFIKWTSNKENPLEVENELQALKRFIEGHVDKSHMCTGVYVENQLVGFCLTEIVNNKFSTIHFCKADVSISPGIYAYLLQGNAEFLLENEQEFVNIEQDLGIEGIRAWKSSHGVDMFLKKYIIEYSKREDLS